MNIFKRLFNIGKSEAHSAIDKLEMGNGSCQVFSDKKTYTPQDKIRIKFGEFGIPVEMKEVNKTIAYPQSI